ncbi:hypothetical protein SSTU70S_05385 [Stutzerimonas stutzeri]
MASIASGDPSPSTAGVFVGLKAAVRGRFGRDDLTRLKVAIQGVGHVGLGLGRHLKAAGAELWVADIFDANVQQAMEELGANVVRPQDIYGLDVDVFAPCAMGGILNEQTLEVLRAPVIAGAARTSWPRRKSAPNCSGASSCTRLTTRSTLAASSTSTTSASAAAPCRAMPTCAPSATPCSRLHPCRRQRRADLGDRRPPWRWNACRPVATRSPRRFSARHRDPRRPFGRHLSSRAGATRTGRALRSLPT